MVPQTDVAFFLERGGSKLLDWELRHAMRSWLKFAPWFRDFWVIGHRPNWLATGEFGGHTVHHRTAPDPYRHNKDANLIQKTVSLCLEDGLTDQFILSCDDHVLIRPVAPDYFDRPIFLDPIPCPPRGTGWQRRLGETAQFLKKQRGVVHPLNFEAHVPYKIDKREFPKAAMRADYGAGVGYTIFSLYFNQVRCESRRIARGDRAGMFSPNDDIAQMDRARVVSFNDNGLTAELRARIETLLPDPAPWERQGGRVVAICDRGLGNRVNSIMSGLMVAELTGKPLEIAWHINDHFPCCFEDVFAPIDGVTVQDDPMGRGSKGGPDDVVLLNQQADPRFPDGFCRPRIEIPDFAERYRRLAPMLAASEMVGTMNRMRNLPDKFRALFLRLNRSKYEIPKAAYAVNRENLILCTDSKRGREAFPDVPHGGYPVGDRDMDRRGVAHCIGAAADMFAMCRADAIFMGTPSRKSTFTNLAQHGFSVPVIYLDRCKYPNGIADRHLTASSGEPYQSEAMGLKRHLDSLGETQGIVIRNPVAFLPSGFATTERGCGFWSWKPWMIQHSLQSLSMSIGTLCYTDSIDRYTREEYELMRDALEVTGWIGVRWMPQFGPAKKWTRRQTFQVMGRDAPKYWESPVVEAGLIMFRKCRQTAEFLDQWRGFCEMRAAVSDDPCEGNFPEFQDHRHDQSILGLLLHDWLDPKEVEITTEITSKIPWKPIPRKQR